MDGYPIDKIRIDSKVSFGVLNFLGRSADQSAGQEAQPVGGKVQVLAAVIWRTCIAGNLLPFFVFDEMLI